MANKEIKFGLREGRGTGKEYPVAANQYFHNRGGRFVYLDAGNVTLAASDTTTIMGWADAPKQASGYQAWKSSSTAEKDKVFVVTNLDGVFELPWDNSLGASLAASLIGAGVGLNNSGSTYTTKQLARYGATATPLKLVDVDTENTTAFVRIKNKQ